MDFEEHAAKPLLAAAGIAVPAGRLVTSVDAAARAAGDLGAVVVKAQVPTGKRGKAGGIKVADTADEAAAAAEAILGMDIAGHTVERLLIEERSVIEREFYAAVLNDAAMKGPMVLFSTLGGMDIEEAAEHDPDQVRRHGIDIRTGFDAATAATLIEGLDLGDADAGDMAVILEKLYAAYRDNDAELLEINPLALTDAGLRALDCKFTLDDSGIQRHIDLAESGTPEKMTALEQRGKDIGIRYIELSGDVGVLANGAGLTMTTMDVIAHHGGKPANFLEIGGEAYTKAKPALELVLSNPKVKVLVINFCGAFARTDVMVGGLVDAWEDLNPTLPVFFCVRGTGEEEAQALLKDRLGITPFETMDDTIRAAVEATR